MELNHDQIMASLEMENWWYSSNDQVFEVSGAAGTGKTTLVRYLIERIGLSLDEVLFVAYMGKAATCMQRNGLPAKTMHSAMYKYTKQIAKDKETGKIIVDEYGYPKLELVFKLRESIGEHIKLIVLDEGSTVSTQMAEDLLSFGLPVIVLGDLNQLPPVFGKSYFLQNPNVILKQIMRQAQNSPIVYLSQRILNGNKLQPGQYGDSAVVRKEDLNESNYRKADIILTATNKLRASVNQMFRERLQKLKRLDIPNRGEKVICRKNNYAASLDGIVLTNGTTGFVEHIDVSSLKNGHINIDFRPDYSVVPYKDLKVDFNTLMGIQNANTVSARLDYSLNKFEFGYAITTHLSQGSQWDKVLVLAEPTSFGPDIQKRLMYTAITRAAKSIIVAI